MLNVLKPLAPSYLTLIATSVAMMLFYASIPMEQLYFDRVAISNGEFIRIVTGHLAHADTEHLSLNVIALVVLGCIIESRSKRLLLSSMIVGVVSVTLFLYSPWSNISLYCGLSGLLNTLLVIALWLLWQETKSKWVMATFLVCFLKIIIEIYLKQSLISHISWPPSPESHLAGFVGGIMMVFYTMTYRRNTTTKKWSK